MGLPNIIGDLAGTALEYFQIGTAYVNRWYSGNGVIKARNKGDTAYTNVAAHSVEVWGSNATNKISLTAAADLAGNVTFVLPATDGSNGQLMKTNGSAVLSFVDPSSNGVLSQSSAFSQTNEGTPVSIFTPPANAIIETVVVVLGSAYSSGSATLSVGTVADPDRDMDELECDLSLAGRKTVSPYSAVGGTPGEIFVTLTNTGGSPTYSGTVYVYYSTPA
jgi:hypothetical protein